MPASTALGSVIDVESFINEYYGAWGGTDEDRIMSYYAENVALQIPGMLMEGKEAVREQFVRPFITAFPGNRHLVKNMIFGPGVVTVEFTFEAEHKGPFAGHAATGVQVKVPGCGVYEYDSAKRQITAARIYFDVGTLLQIIADSLVDDRKTEEALQSNECNLSLLTNVIPTFIHVLRSDGSVLYVNQAVLSYTGLTLEDVRKEDYRARFFHPEDVERLREKRAEALLRPVPFENEQRVLGKDGKYRWFLIRYNPLLDEQGRIDRWYVAACDIEDRKQAEDAQARQANVRADVSAAFSKPTQLREILSGCTEAIVRHLDAAFARIWMLSRDESMLELQASAGMYKRLDGSYSRIPVGDLKVGWIAREKKAHLTNDVLNDPRVNDKGWAQHNGMVAFAGYPLVVEDRLIGVVALFARRPLPESILDTLASVADTIAQGIERKRAEEALRNALDEIQKSESNLRRVIDAIPALAWCNLPDGPNEFLSKRWHEYTGLSAGESHGWGWQAAFHPEDLPPLMERWMKMLASGEPDEIEARLRRHDGVYRWFLIRAEAFRDESGKIVRWYGTSTDIDDRKRAEEALRSSERNLAAIINTIPTTAWTTRADGHCDFLNRVWLDYAGMTAEQAQGWGWAEAIHPDDREKLAEEWESCLASGTPVDTEARIRRFDSSYRWFLIRANPLRDESGNILKWYGTCIDIEDCKRVEEVLRAKELSWRQIVDNIPGLVATTGAMGEVEFLNRQTLEYFGKTSEELKNWALINAVHPDDLPRVIEARKKSIEAGQIYEVEHRCRRADGIYRWFQVRGVPVRDTKGAVTSWYLLLTDIEERKQAEDKLRESGAYLAEAQKLSQTGSWAWNPATGEIRYWSEECYRVLGFDPFGPPPRFDAFFQRLHPDDQAASRERFEAAVRDRADFELDYRIVHPERGIRDIHSIGHAVLSRSGDLAEFVGTVIDITERKRAEQELRQLVDFVPQVIVVFGPDGEWIHANRVAREYTGLTLDKYRSVDVINSVIHPDDRERMRTVRARRLASNAPFEIDVRLLGKDGTYRWFLFHYNPLVEQGCVRRWYMTGTEIEARKQEEERVRKENVRLEERTRIAQELHDTLLQSFLSASMQLGAALESIPTDSLIKPRLDRVLQITRQGIEEGRKAIRDLRSSDSQVSDLVLALSRIQQELDVQPDIDFRVIVAGRQKQLPPETQHEIYRIGRESLVNAFCHSGGKRVELKLEYSDSEIRMRIRDNGCGIDPQVLESGRAGHWGLAGMRERATRIGAVLDILSDPRTGTEVQLSIPTGIASRLSPSSQLGIAKGMS